MALHILLKTAMILQSSCKRITGMSIFCLQASPPEHSETCKEHAATQPCKCLFDDATSSVAAGRAFYMSERPVRRMPLAYDVVLHQEHRTTLPRNCRVRQKCLMCSCVLCQAATLRKPMQNTRRQKYVRHINSSKKPNARDETHLR